MAGVEAIILLVGVGIAGYFFYQECIVNKKCGLPGVGGPEVPGYVGPPVINQRCGGGYVLKNNKCLCNTQVKPCQKGYGLFIDSQTCVCQECAALGRYSCPAGTKGIARSSGVGCDCVSAAGKTTPPASKPPASKPPVSSGCPGKSGNCNWDCKNAYCWTSAGPKVNKVCVIGPSPSTSGNRVNGCNIARNKFIDANKVACASCCTCRGGACKNLRDATCTACCNAKPSGYTSTSFRARAQFRPQRRQRRPQYNNNNPTIRGQAMMAQTIMFG